MARPKSENPKTDQIFIRITTEEKELITWAAAVFGVSVSHFVRSQSLSQARQLREEAKPFFPQQPPLTCRSDGEGEREEID